jgi:tRNA 2-thiouridine synthesizing protein B
MGVLHLVSRSSDASSALSLCLERAGMGDAVLLLEAGVYAAMKDSQWATRLAASMPQVSVHALAPDLAARGIATGEMLAGVGLVDYQGFVELCIRHAPIMSWG